MRYAVLHDIRLAPYRRMHCSPIYRSSSVNITHLNSMHVFVVGLVCINITISSLNDCAIWVCVKAAGSTWQQCGSGEFLQYQVLSTALIEAISESRMGLRLNWCLFFWKRMAIGVRRGKRWEGLVQFLHVHDRPTWIRKIITWGVFQCMCYSSLPLLHGRYRPFHTSLYSDCSCFLQSLHSLICNASKLYAKYSSPVTSFMLFVDITYISTFASRSTSIISHDFLNHVNMCILYACELLRENASPHPQE